jgi:hypothetical protein
MTLVAVLEQPFHEALADHTFRMTLQDSDGHDMPEVQVQGQFRFAPGPDMRYGEAGVQPIPVPIHGLKFERPGSYAFVLTVDDKELARYPFRVIQLFAAMAPVRQAGG